MIDGLSSEPAKFSGGIGFNYALFEIGYAFYNHQDFGLTHQASITINFGGEKGRVKMRESLKAAFGKK